MSTQHTPLRITVYSGSTTVDDANGNVIARCADRKDAEHIVQCVNACAGLPTDALDGGWTAMGVSRYAKSLEDALRGLLAEVTTPDEEWVKDSAVNRARAVLAKVTASAP